MKKKKKKKKSAVNDKMTFSLLSQKQIMKFLQSKWQLYFYLVHSEFHLHFRIKKIFFKKARFGQFLPIFFNGSICIYVIAIEWLFFTSAHGNFNDYLPYE